MAEIYLVGGAVRDELLGLPIQEKDWVIVGSTPNEMLKKGFQQVGKDFPVFIHPETGEEYALARTERKSGRGYTGFECYSAPDVTLEDDLKRRDFTINAIAKDSSGRYIDPFNGRQDLKNHIFRHVSTAFVEDPLRILRGARFATRFTDFHFATETMSLMREMVRQGELNDLIPERVCQELLRALTNEKPTRFFETLKSCSALSYLFPEINRLFGIPQDPKWHPEIDTGEHVMMVLDQATKLSPNPRVRFAALLHDLGKGETPKEQLPSHSGHEEKSIPLIDAFCDRLKIPNDYRDLARLVARYHGICHDIFEKTAEELIDFIMALDPFRRPDRFNDFVLSCEADYKGRTGYENQNYKQGFFLKNLVDACSSIETKSLIQNGASGLAIANAIRQARIDRIQSLIKSRNDS